jgi:hypothetical protein
MMVSVVELTNIGVVLVVDIFVVTLRCGSDTGCGRLAAGLKGTEGPRVAPSVEHQER